MYQHGHNASQILVRKEKQRERERAVAHAMIVAFVLSNGFVRFDRNQGLTDKAQS